MRVGRARLCLCWNYADGGLKTTGEITAFVKPSRWLTKFVSYTKSCFGVSASSLSDYVAESDLSAASSQQDEQGSLSREMVGSDRVFTLLIEHGGRVCLRLAVVPT